MTPKTLFGLRIPNFWGVILLQLFDPSNGLEVGNVQNSHFWAKSALDISKSAAQIKKCYEYREVQGDDAGKTELVECSSSQKACFLEIKQYDNPWQKGWKIR